MEIIQHLLRLDPITAGYILLTDNLVALKRNNSDPILIMKRTEQRKFIDYIGLSIDANLFRLGKRNICIVHIGYISVMGMQFI